jgi:amino acid transporter
MQKKIGTTTGIASILGLMLLASSLLTITQGISIGGYVFFVGLGISYILMMCQSASFAELAGILPTEGAVYDYVTAGMGRFWGVTATLAAYVIVTCFASSAEVAAAGLFAKSNFSFLSFIPEGQTWIIGWTIVIACIFINIRGLQLYAITEIIMSYFKYAIMILFGIAGVLLVPKVSLPYIWGDSQIGSDWSALFTMIGFSLFLFVGAEYVTPLAPEMENPHKNIKNSLFIGLTLSLFAMLLFGTGIAWQVPNTIDNATNLPVLETTQAAVLYGEAIAGSLGKTLFTLVIFIATVALINTIIASIPRILCGMAHDKMLPAIFAKMHPRYNTPYIGILFIGAIPMLGSFLLGANVEGVISLILSAICSWIFFYVLINIAVILLRNRRPDLPRPYKTPFYPIPQILATLGLLITFFYLTPPNLTAAQIYIPFFFMLGLCALYAFFWLQNAKTDMWKPVEPEEILGLGD